MVKRRCEQCRVEYETFPSVKPRYCSASCAGQAKRTGEFIECEQCGKKYWRALCRSNARFCSKSCSRTALNLSELNPSFHRDISGDRNPMHGKRMIGEDNPMFGKRKELSPNWNGGRREGHSSGYVRVVAPDDHPFPCDTMSTGTKYILEHRLVMEQHLGRYLTPKEVVHHIDEDTANNSIENLALCADSATHLRTYHSS